MTIGIGVSQLHGLNLYPKIYTIGHSAIKDIFFDTVLVEEKIDGSQFSMGRFNNVLKVGSRSKEIIIDAPERMFQTAINVAQALDLHNGWTYRCEYLSKPKHNTLAYDRVPCNNLIIFDINTRCKCYLSYEDKRKEAERLGLEVVPLLYYGKVNSIEQFMSYLDIISILGGQKIEGIVIKNYSRFGNDGKVLLGKYVSEKYKEIHNKSWRIPNPGDKDVIQNIINELRTDVRWEKAVQHLKESGLYTGSPRDIDGLIKEVKNDISHECIDIIINALLSYAMPKIKCGIVAGVAEWYKEKLLKEQFNIK